ncbi:hypothetical protein KGR20_21095 [Cytobacillus oceanisediminis]|uniref:helix-turn-helix domain-containing protein n=1 Tax=Cytobacillus oceanisediminis TaxID=665099 RepID=UPI001CC8F071|nr:helix-turn-helix domain-containing protein [Cytobacillus oceanisediminis]MBZ9536663.1 hypothetical protein [Cytobacillus oceanisediminis]
MITVTLKEAYKLINNKDVKSVSASMKQYLFKKIKENFGDIIETGRGKSYRISFNYVEEQEVIITRKTRSDKKKNYEKVLHHLCENYNNIDFDTNEKISTDLKISVSTVKNVIRELRETGYLESRLKKEKTKFKNRTGEIDTYMKDVNKNTYFFKYYDGECIEVDRKLYALYFQWRSDWQYKYYEEEPLSKKAVCGSYEAFNRIHGFIPMKKHTRKPKEEVMKMLDYEIPNKIPVVKEWEYEPIEDAYFDDLCEQEEFIYIESIEDETNEMKDFSVPVSTVVIVTDRVKSRKNLSTIHEENNHKGFGKITKFEAEILPSEELETIIA